MPSSNCDEFPNLFHDLRTVKLPVDQWMPRSRVGLAEDLVKEYESKHGKKHAKESAPKPHHKTRK